MKLLSLIKNYVYCLPRLGKPLILSFTADPYVLIEGAIVKLSWTTRGAYRVKIGEKDSYLNQQQCYVYLSAETKELKLTAYGCWGKLTKIIRVEPLSIPAKIRFEARLTARPKITIDPAKRLQVLPNIKKIKPCLNPLHIDLNTQPLIDELRQLQNH